METWAGELDGHGLMAGADPSEGAISSYMA